VSAKALQTDKDKLSRLEIKPNAAEMLHLLGANLMANKSRASLPYR